MSTANLHRGILGLAAATLMTPVLAQEGISFIEEIVVTSTKMSSTLQEVPVAVSVVGAEDIKESQVLDIKDLQFMVPSLRVGQLQSSGNTNFFIRGFGNGANNAGIEPSVGVFHRWCLSVALRGGTHRFAKPRARRSTARATKHIVRQERFCRRYQRNNGKTES